MMPGRITEPLVSVLSRFSIRVTYAAAALAAATLTVEPSTIAAPAVGRIEGTVRLVSPGTVPIVSGAYPARRVSTPAAAASELSNIVVFIRNAPRDRSLAPSRIEMVQKGESFVPRVVAITRGSTVEFPNADPFFHNVFSLSRTAAFDLGRFPRGERRARTFTRPGLVKVYCHLHSHMSASIMVFDHSYFTVPAKDGTFVLSDVPTGDLQLSAWHERIGESSKPLTIEAGQTTRVEFVLPVEGRE